MSANVPTDICFSFSGLMQRGGVTGPHTDGWGIAFYEGHGCRSFHDPHPGAHSEIAHLVRQYPIKSHIVVSHIRKANRGRVCLENTHPFTRELWGEYWTFAHNGQLKGIKKQGLDFYQCVGTTDSEHAFCWILDRLRKRFPRKPPNRKVLWQSIGELTAQLNRRGVFNMLMSDSTCLYTACSTRLCWLTRSAPFGRASLIDEEMSVDFSQETTPDDVVTMVATQPLTANEDWECMKKGEFQVFRDGRPCL